MSSAAASTATLKPEIRLAQAVSVFEADLTNKEKTEYRKDIAPEASDVMRFIAQFDRVTRQSQKGFRVYGLRLANFLDGVHIFAMNGYVGIGGIQNTVSWAVWSLVKIFTAGRNDRDPWYSGLISHRLPLNSNHS